MRPSIAADITVDREGTIWRDRMPYTDWEEVDALEHIQTHKCGTLSGVDRGVNEPNRRRKLAQSDCTATFTNPAEEYIPTSGPVYQVNMVVHVITNGALTSSPGYISDTCVQSGITLLNNDFRAVTGTKGAGGVDTRIQFALATTNAAGASTTGIVRHNNEGWFNQGKTLDQQGNDGTLDQQAWDKSRYMNVFLKATGDSLGYATLAPDAESSADGVTIRYDVWGSCATHGSYNQGATMTHEVGHYLGLEHTFSTIGGTCGGSLSSPVADKPNCYFSGDLICDTNPQAATLSATCGCSWKWR